MSNWYILHVITLKSDRLCESLNNQGHLYAFTPMMEYYRRDKKANALKALFPGYIFIKTKMDQEEFDAVLFHMKESKDGLIRQLKYNDATALKNDEIEVFEKLIDSSGIVRMSKAYLENKKAVVYEGPLKSFENDIVKVDKHNQIAYLRFEFMGRNIQVGLNIDR